MSEGAIVIRVNKVYIGKDVNNTYEWKDNFDFRWADVSPWEHIEIPGGVMIHQHIHSPHVMGTLKIRNLTRMITALYNTVIDNNNHYAIMSDARKYTVGYFKIELAKADGNIQTIIISNFKVLYIATDEVRVGIEATFTVHFSADLIQYT